MGKGKRWTEEEIAFLKRSYEEYSIEEIAEALGRNSKGVVQKAMSFNLSKRKHEAPEGQKYCSKCKRNLPFENFAKNKTKQHGLSEWCKECRNNWFRERTLKKKLMNSDFVKEKEKLEKLKLETEDKAYTCTSCKKEKLGKNFYFLSSGKRENFCIECRKDKVKKGELERIKKGVLW